VTIGLRYGRIDRCDAYLPAFRIHVSAAVSVVVKRQYYGDSRPVSPNFYGIFSQKHCNKFGEFQALFLVLNGTAVKTDTPLAPDPEIVMRYHRSNLSID
jgi:hypothetical protein